MPADGEHDNAGDEIWDRIEHAYLSVAAARQALEDCGEPHFVTIGADVQAEVHGAKEPDGRTCKSTEEGVGLRIGGFRWHLDEALLNPGFLPIGEPGGVFWTIGEHKQNNDANEYRRERFKEEKPLPGS